MSWMRRERCDRNRKFVLECRFERGGGLDICIENGVDLILLLVV